MRTHYMLVLLFFVSYQSSFGRQGQIQNSLQEPLYTDLVVKKKIHGSICNTCELDFAHLIAEAGSFVIAGAGHTSSRLSRFRDSIHSAYTGDKAIREDVFIISGAQLSLTFLPHFFMKNGSRLPLYRNWRGVGYHQLEYMALQNGKTIRTWTPIASLRETPDYAFLGVTRGSGKNSVVPWVRSYFAGNYQLALKDTISIVVRNIETKMNLQSISIFRAVDSPTNFIYYQVPLNNERFSQNLQNILNLSDEPSKVFNGNTLDVFQKDFKTIGIIRFLGMGKNEKIQYSFEDEPYRWQSLSSLNSENGVFLVLGNDMEGGKNHHVYLRYQNQPETVHKITIQINEKKFEIPWVTIAVFSVVMLTLGGFGFYIWQIRNRRKLTKLKSRHAETEARLALLSGQLNPHFLFNSLNAIQGNIWSGNPDKVYNYIGDVAAFMRNVMDSGKKEFISLQEELHMESDYLKLEQERIEFIYTMHVDAQLEPTQIDIPPLLLQPVLENSIRHGFGQDQPNPTLNLRVCKRGNNLIIEITDNGNMEWDTVHKPYRHGLSLTAKRIDVYNEKFEGMQIQMEISYLQGKGTMTIFTFLDWLA